MFKNTLLTAKIYVIMKFDQCRAFMFIRRQQMIVVSIVVHLIERYSGAASSLRHTPADRLV